MFESFKMFKSFKSFERLERMERLKLLKVCERRVLHLDMDAFFASVEQAANPRLRTKALIVGGRATRKRTVVCTASYQAKRLHLYLRKPNMEFISREKNFKPGFCNRRG